MKKIVALALALCMVFGLTAFAKPAAASEPTLSIEAMAEASRRMPIGQATVIRLP